MLSIILEFLFKVFSFVYAWFSFVHIDCLCSNLQEIKTIIYLKPRSPIAHITLSPKNDMWFNNDKVEKEHGDSSYHSNKLAFPDLNFPMVRLFNWNFYWDIWRVMCSYKK